MLAFEEDAELPAQLALFPHEILLAPKETTKSTSWKGSSVVVNVLLSHHMAKSWEELGKRVLAARKDLGLTQIELATQMRVDRTVVTKIEVGERKVDSLELARLATALRRPIAWFVSEPPPAVISRRAERDVTRREDIQLETLVQDVEQLIEFGLLQPPPARFENPAPLDSIEATEQVALEARRAAGLDPAEPAWDLVRIVERLGLYAFVLTLDPRSGTEMDGSYVALPRGGVALIGDAGESGRRRFTLAHELGHHVLADEYAAEWIVGAGATDREKLISAFAIHFLMPRSAIQARWTKLKGAADPRDATIRLAVEFGMSWSAACAQVQRVGCLAPDHYNAILRSKPTSVDLMERELSIRSDVVAPLVPPGYAAAVIKALRRGKIGPNRAQELLHETILARDLPGEPELPIESMTAELDLLPE